MINNLNNHKLWDTISKGNPTMKIASSYLPELIDAIFNSNRDYKEFFQNLVFDKNPIDIETSKL